jgi:hypothetical protein
MSVSVQRKTQVVAGIVAASAAVGAAAGVVTAGLIALAYREPRVLLDGEVMVFASGVGAACGAVLGPAAAFGFMRRVPLGRLFGQTAIGTVAGGLAGFAAGFFLPLGLAGVVGAAAVGFTTAATRLAWRHRGEHTAGLLPPGA